MYSSISPHESQFQSQPQSSPWIIPQTFSFSCNDEMSFNSMPMFHPYFTTTTSTSILPQIMGNVGDFPRGTTKTPHQKPNDQHHNEPSRRRKQISQKKERNCKIATAQGLRDRRVRLSIDIARQFFDLQDSLGFDTASKTLDWLLTKSRTAIKEQQSTTTKLADEEENAKPFEAHHVSTTTSFTTATPAGDEDSNKNNTTFCTKEERPKARVLRAKETTMPLNTEPSSFRLLQPIKSCITCESELFCFCLLNGITPQIDPQETFGNFGVITKKFKPSTVISDNLEFNSSCNTFLYSNNFINSSGDLQEIFQGIQR